MLLNFANASVCSRLFFTAVTTPKAPGSRCWPVLSCREFQTDQQSARLISCYSDVRKDASYCQNLLPVVKCKLVFHVYCISQVRITGKFPGYLSPSAGLKFADVPNGLAAISKVPAAGWGQILAYMAFCEGFPGPVSGHPSCSGRLRLQGLDLQRPS